MNDWEGGVHGEIDEGDHFHSILSWRDGNPSIHKPTIDGVGRLLLVCIIHTYIHTYIHTFIHNS